MLPGNDLVAHLPTAELSTNRDVCHRLALHRHRSSERPRTAQGCFTVLMSTARVIEIHTYPVKDEPGTTLPQVDVEEAGLAGDRRKKAPVHLISREQAEGVRANFVLDASPEELSALAPARWSGLGVPNSASWDLPAAAQASMPTSKPPAWCGSATR